MSFLRDPFSNLRLWCKQGRINHCAGPGCKCPPRTWVTTLRNVIRTGSGGSNKAITASPINDCVFITFYGRIDWMGPYWRIQKMEVKLIPTKHIIGHIGDGFYTTNSVKALNEDRFKGLGFNATRSTPPCSEDGTSRLFCRITRDFPPKSVQVGL